MMSPITIESTVAVPTSTIVWGAAAQISSSTGWLLAYERPKLSCTVCSR